MKHLLRLLLVYVAARRRPTRPVADVSRIAMRVMPNDLDVYGHMNNGSFLTLQDLGRTDWMIRTGLLERFSARRWGPVVVAQTISYRASLQPFERFLIETRYLGRDEFSVIMEQRFTVDGEIRAQSYVRARFVGPQGTVPMPEVLALVPEVAALPDLVPDWVHEWGEHTRLPSRRTPTPSRWVRGR